MALFTALGVLLFFLYEELMRKPGSLGYTDLVALAQGAGFTGGDEYIAAAIALAESGGDPNAVGDTTITPGGSVGLWQINLHFHPEYDPQQLREPVYNASAAFDIYTEHGNSFRDWSTFKSGAYQQYVQNEGDSTNGG